MGMASAKAFSVASMLRCDRITPLGTPVEPDVYMMMAVSEGDGGTESVGNTGYINTVLPQMLR